MHAIIFSCMHAWTNKLEDLESDSEEFGYCDHNQSDDSGSDSDDQKLLSLSPLAKKSSPDPSSTLSNHQLFLPSSNSTPIHQSSPSPPPPLSNKQQIVKILHQISPEDLVLEFSSMISDGSQNYGMV